MEEVNYVAQSSTRMRDNAHQIGRRAGSFFLE